MSSNWIAEKYKAMDLTKRIRDGKIKIPHYQRGQVWNDSQKAKLIDSIKRGFPFGSILLYKKDDGSFQLIDGLQRVSTLYEYLFNPAKFFKQSDISAQAIDDIFNLLNIRGGSEKEIKSKIQFHIKSWVRDNHQTMEDVKKINAVNCAKNLKSVFPTCKDESVIEITSILISEFQKFSSKCEELADVGIPAIVYEGDPGNLPEVFNRINSKGTTLSKYQILSATWSTYEYVLSSEELDPIIKYVNDFYTTIINERFSIDGYDLTTAYETKKLNLYQIIFGFGKLLCDRFPNLFSNAKSEKEVESCGFTLINSCIGNKNKNLANLPSILNNTFDNDCKQINEFLVNILHSTGNVYKLLKPYLEFKLNKRSSTKDIYHTELQICSMIANYFNARYCTYTFDDDQAIIGRNIKTNCSNKSFDNFNKTFKRNAFKEYLIDIINNIWRGSGDKRLDDVSINRNYYTNEITEAILIEELDHWINQINLNRHERSKITNPKAPEKLLLSVIYSHSFSAYEQNDDINYDIEHLAPKACLKELLKTIPNQVENMDGLPISSFSNLCLLREEINRKKKQKTLYQDKGYLDILEEKNISLNEIEQKFTFTKSSDLDWVLVEYNDFEKLRNNYLEFLNKRFKIQKEHIINNLFPNNNGNIYYKSITNSNSIASLDQPNSIDSVSNDDTLKETNEVYTTDYNEVIEKLDGWKRDVFDIIDRFDFDTFTLLDVYRFNEELKQKHPTNNTINAKIRQILQQLRNLGLIEFEEKGKYRRLWM